MTQNAVTPQYRYLLSQLKRRLIAGSFPRQCLIDMADAVILLFRHGSVKHFGRRSAPFSIRANQQLFYSDYVNSLVRFMHFHSVENPVQKVENPLFVGILFLI